MLNQTPTLWQSISQLKRSSSKLNSYEIQCLNVLISTIAKQEEKTIHENILFAKLYAVLMLEFSRHYKDITMANKLINKELSVTLENHLEKLKIQFQFIELDNYLNSFNITDPLLAEKDLNQTQQKLKEYPNVFPEINYDSLKESWDSWNIDTVTANFQTAINQSIINFKNLP